MIKQGLPVVLIVDDEKSNLMILSDLLRDKVKIVLAKSGQQAIDKASEIRPDLILLDVVMPDMDGFDTIIELKKINSIRSVPVIFISALNDVESESKGLELGACDYIHKPFHADIVQARIKIHLKLVEQRRLLERLANIDPLTSIGNRRKFNERLKEAWQQSKQNQHFLSLVMIDIDFFKQYNDSFGHASGDIVLENVAKALENQINTDVDLVARYGGEEFVLILPNKTKIKAMEIVQSCRQAIKDLEIPHPRQDQINYITVSMGGVICIPSNDPKASADAVLRFADQLLYQAKQEGRNKVVWGEINIEPIDSLNS